MTSVELSRARAVAASAPASGASLGFAKIVGGARFGLRTWLALALALYGGFFLQLDSAASAGICVMMLAQPVQGMVLSKAIYRTIGTLVGVVVAVAITSLYPQDRTMILAAFTVWMGLCTATASMLRDFRAYGAVLSGYTVGIISIANIDAPDATFMAAIDRVAAILTGIIAIALVNSLLIDAGASRSLLYKLRHATSDIIGLATRTLDRRTPVDAWDCVAMAARIMPLRGEISFASPELPDGGRRAKGARSALLGLFELLTVIQAVGLGLERAGEDSSVVAAAIPILRRALHLQRPERLLPELDALAAPRLAAGSLALEEAYVLDRARFMITVLGDIRDGLKSVRTGRMPRRVASVPLHQDYLSALLNFTRVVLAVGVICALGVWSGQAATSLAVLFTAVYVPLGSLAPTPTGMARSALFGLPIAVAVGAIYEFFVLPTISGFPLFIVSLAPLILLTCYFMVSGRQGLGSILGVMTLLLLGPSNPQVLDPTSFVTSGVMFVLSGLLVALSFRVVIPIQPPMRRLRLALAVGSHLRRALADEGRLPQPRASLHYDRLLQYKQWLGDGPISLARRKTMGRLADFGHLAFAVRRAWRALDAAKAMAPEGLDAKARRVLPTLYPDETLGVARAYLAAAAGQPTPTGLALAHAAAALFGAASLTRREARLLRRVELLRPVL